MAAAEADVKTAAKAAPPKKKRRLLPALGLFLVLVGAGAGAYVYFGGALPWLEGESAEAAPASPIYVSLEPPFVVNLEDSELLRFLQVELQVMTRDPATPKALELHEPVIRNNLLLIFASERVDALGTRDGKVALAQRVTEEINAVLAERAGGLAIEETYFTSFVMQ